MRTWQGPRVWFNTWNSRKHTIHCEWVKMSHWFSLGLELLHVAWQLCDDLRHQVLRNNFMLTRVVIQLIKCRQEGSTEAIPGKTQEATMKIASLSLLKRLSVVQKHSRDPYLFSSSSREFFLGWYFFDKFLWEQRFKSLSDIIYYMFTRSTFLQTGSVALPLHFPDTVFMHLPKDHPTQRSIRQSAFRYSIPIPLFRS